MPEDRVTSPRRLVVAICIAEIFSMWGIATFPSLQPTLINEWGLSNTETGWINGIYYVGYLVAVAVLVSATDRMPPRRIYAVCMLLSAAAQIGFAWLADGFWGAMAFRLLAGIGLAGTYMPGLKLLSDHLERAEPDKDHSRTVAFYTSSFGVGSALSYLFAGMIAAQADWQWAFVAAGIGPLIALAIAYLALPRRDPEVEKPDTHLLDFRPVLRTKRAMGYVLAYTAHNFELFAMRSWIVSYLVFSASAGPTGNYGIPATVIAAAVNLLGLPASVLGNEIARTIGRVRWITIIMLTSAALAAGIGFGAALPYWLVVVLVLLYGVTVTGDSSSITAGVVRAAPAGYKGATMAVHSSIGFMGGFLGPLAFGGVLDLASGPAGETVTSWGLAFAFTGAVLTLGPLTLRLLSGGKNGD